MVTKPQPFPLKGSQNDDRWWVWQKMTLVKVFLSQNGPNCVNGVPSFLDWKSSLISGRTWKFPSCILGPHLCLLPVHFPLWSKCNQLWHVKTRPLSVRTLLVLLSVPPLPPPKCPLSHLPISLPTPHPPTSAVLMNIKMPLGPPKHLWSHGWRGLALWSCTLSSPIAHHWASAPAAVKNKPQKEPFLRKNIRKWKTDRTTGEDNTRQNTITPHPMTVGHCDCYRQRRDGGGSRCGRGGGWGGTVGANGVMSYQAPEWQLVNWGGLADQIKGINSRKWTSRAAPEMAISNEAKCKWRRKEVVKTLKLTIKGWWSARQWPSISSLITFMWN